MDNVLNLEMLQNIDTFELFHEGYTTSWSYCICDHDDHQFLNMLHLVHYEKIKAGSANTILAKIQMHTYYKMNLQYLVCKGASTRIFKVHHDTTTCFW